MEIVPALLTDCIEKLEEMVQRCREFTEYVQIDIMDGEFVPSRSFSLLQAEKLNIDINFEVHLMVKDPLPWAELFIQKGAGRIIFHYEIEKKQHPKIINYLKEKSVSIGMAINPDTDWQEVKPYIESNYIDYLLFMSVYPGFYGADFVPEVLNKLANCRREYNFNQLSIGIDGGVKLGNLLDIVKMSPDYICVGSAIMKAENPAQAYKKFVGLLEEIDREK